MGVARAVMASHDKGLPHGVHLLPSGKRRRRKSAADFAGILEQFV
jgi:hypothetical protein